MGATQSQPRAISPEPYISPSDRAQAQVEMRAKQQAALDKRIASQQRRASPTVTASASQSGAPRATAGRKLSALEQMSRENVGWRDADKISEMRSWN